MTGRRKNKTQKSTEKKEKNFIVEYIISHKEIIGGIYAGVDLLYTIVNEIYKIMYQNECEKFYGIPGKYFDSNVNNRLLYLCVIIIFLLISIVPTLMKKEGKKKKNVTESYLLDAVFLSVVIGECIGLINGYNLIEIMKQTNKTNGFFRGINSWVENHAYFTIMLVIGSGLISVLGITLIDELKNIKKNWIKKAVCVILLVALVASALLMLYGTMFKLSISIENKTKYEFVTYGEEYVILSVYDKKVLIVPFEIDEKGQYVFKTNLYLFGEQYEGKYQYRDIKDSPRIDSDIKQ